MKKLPPVPGAEDEPVDLGRADLVCADGSRGGGAGGAETEAAPLT